jgi:hypothetical protein
MTFRWLKFLSALQFLFWWIAPNSAAFFAVRRFYARRVRKWLDDPDIKTALHRRPRIR